MLNGLATVSRVIDAINEHVGRAVAWLALFMVLDQFAVVILRYVFSVGYIMMQESIWYQHGMLFMVGAGYTLWRNGHVRVDILYREATVRHKALVDLLGVVFFLLPLCVLIAWLSWNYVIHAWEVYEGSVETGGVPAVFLLKSLIWVFVLLLGLQGISMAARSILVLLGVEDAAPPVVPHETHELV